MLLTGSKTGGVFEASVSLKKPYSIAGLSVLFENYNSMTQGFIVCKELLTTLTRESFVMFTNLESSLSRRILAEYNSGKILCISPLLKVNLSLLIERLRKENQEAGNHNIN